LEVDEYKTSVPYFVMAARTDRSRRDMLLVAAAYARRADDPDLALELQKEYLSQIVFEAASKNEVIYAINVLLNATNLRTAGFLRSLRINMETDEDMKKVVKQRLEREPTIEIADSLTENLISDTRIDNLLRVDLERTWLKPEMHVLVSL